MSEKNSDIMEKIPSKSSSPASIERAEIDSSQVPGSPSHWDYEESCVSIDRLYSDARIRQSSWDSSDNDLSPRTERSPEPTRLYSYDSSQFQKSVTFEINELKKQFFETLEKMKDENDIRELENLKDKIESTLNSDRRQSPARMRRRTKSSSSSSPVLESKSHNSPKKIEKLNEPEAVFEELSTKISDFDSKFYLNNFFTEIRSRRISLMDVTPGTENQREPDYESECIQIPSEISTDPSENDDRFCKTSRKLSKILEVEENKTDLEKSSEEKINNSELFSKTLKNPDEKHISPLQTARSRKSQTIPENIKESKTEKEEKYKSLSYEEFGNFCKVEKPFQGSLSERSTKIFNSKINDNFISLTAKNEKMQMDFNDQRFFLNPMETNKDSSREPNFTAEEKEKNFGSKEHLNMDLTKGLSFENSSSRKSTDRSERTPTSRSISAKSRRSINSDSPMFTINLGKDSDRSLRIEDLNTPSSSKKVKTHSEVKASSTEDCSSFTFKNCNKSTDRSEGRFELKTERSLQRSQKSSNLTLHRSLKEQDINYLQSNRSYHAWQQEKKKQKKDNQNLGFETNESNFTFSVEKAESYSSVESNRSYESFRTKFSRRESFIKINDMDTSDSFENQSDLKSRSSKSDKRTDLKAKEEDQLYDQNTSENDKIHELGLPLEISASLESNEESHRSVKTIESDTKECDLSETDLLKRASPRASVPSLSSRSKNTESKRSTYRSLKITSRSNSGGSSRSKSSLENRNNSENTESLHTVAWKELEKLCDTVNNHTSVSSASSTSSWKEVETQDQQNSSRKKLFNPPPDGSDIMVTPKNILNEQLSKSRSSRKSPNSQITELLEYNNSDRSTKTKLRPMSGNSDENEVSDRSFKTKSRPMSENSEEIIKNSDRSFKTKSRSMSENSEENVKNSDRSFKTKSRPMSENSEEIIKNSDRSFKTKSRPMSENSEKNIKNSDRSFKTKSRPMSGNSEELKIQDIHSEVEKLNMDATTNRLFTFIEDEDREKSSPNQKYEIETENIRNSNKRLSIINEVSFESLQISTENKEENVCEHPGKSNERLSPQSAKKTPNHSDRSLKGDSLDELSSKMSNPDDGKWNELIEKFCPNSNTSCASENTFPSFSNKKENSFDSDGEVELEENSANNRYLENPIDLRTLSKRSEDEYASLENNLSFERVFEEKEALNLEFKQPSLKKELEEKDIRTMQKSQNLFYLNLHNNGPFGIGEFGDVTCWNACKSDTIDSEKPKDHGDGAQTQKASEVPILHEKRMNEVKTQRNLWTELRKNVRDSKPLLNKLFLEADDRADFSHFIPVHLKTSKSDNCIKPKGNAGSDFQTSPTCKFLDEYNGMPKSTENKFLEFENNKKRKKEVKSTSKSVTKRHSSIESLEFETEDSENEEFECEITPRLSTSMYNIETQSQEDGFMNRESGESFRSSTTQLFEKSTEIKNHENEMTDLNIFLAPNERKDKMTAKSNWLHLKNPEKEKSHERGKKIKRKRKNLSSPKEPYHEYLYSRKNKSNVSQLKLRNSNCFQNFYKRFISVFCLTSHSSSATSK